MLLCDVMFCPVLWVSVVPTPYNLPFVHCPYLHIQYTQYTVGIRMWQKLWNDRQREIKYLLTSLFGWVYLLTIYWKIWPAMWANFKLWRRASEEVFLLPFWHLPFAFILLWHILGNFLCTVVTLVTFISNFNNSSTRTIHFYLDCQQIWKKNWRVALLIPDPTHTNYNILTNIGFWWNIDELYSKKDFFPQ